MRRRDVLRLAVAVSLVGGTGRVRGKPEFEPLGSIAVASAREAVVGPGDIVYVATVSGFAVVDVADPRDPTLLSDMHPVLADHERGPLGGIQDVAVEGDQLLVVGPANHANEDALHAAVVYDVSEPSAPTRLSTHETSFPIHNATLHDGVAYLTGNDRDQEPLVIINPGKGELARWSIPGHDDRWRDVNPWLRNLHDVIVHDGRAYCSYWDAGTWVVDVTDPASPTYLGDIGGRPRDELIEEESIGPSVSQLPGNHHSAAVNETGTLLAIGQEAWSSDPSLAPGGIDLWAVLDPSRPLHLAHISPPPTEDPSYDGVWTTAHNFELRDARLYAAWYQGGITVHDVADPRNPVEIAAWRDDTAAKFWTAQRASDHVVASDIGIGEGGGELVTFPDPARATPTPAPTTESPTPLNTPTSVPTTTPTQRSSAPTTIRGQSAGRVGTSGGEAAVGIGILAALGLAIRRWRR